MTFWKFCHEHPVTVFAIVAVVAVALHDTLASIFSACH